MHLNVLGHMVVVDDGARIPVSSAKQRTLLALLALNARQPVATDVIMRELWPEQEQSATAGTLRTHVFQLRRTLGNARRRPEAALLRAECGGYLFADEVRLDVDEFNRRVAEGRAALRAGDFVAADARFEQALEVWRGPVLADVPRGPHLEAVCWRLEEAKILVHGHRADIKLRLGMHREMLPDLAGLVQSYPLDEGIALKYMIALHLSDRRADALTHYQHLRRKLGDGLGLDPSRRLQEAHAAILNARSSTIDLLKFA